MSKCLLSIFLGINMIINAQEITFKVVSESNSPISYASAVLKQNRIGTISNEDGMISFIKSPEIFSDTLIVSHLGYETLLIPFECVKNTKILKLIKKEIEIEEIIVPYKSPRKIIKKASDLMPLNYPVYNSNYFLLIDHLMYSSEGVLTRFNGTIFASLSKGKRKNNKYFLVSNNYFIDNRKDDNFIIPYYLETFPDKLIEKDNISQLDFVSKLNKYYFRFAEPEDNNVFHIQFYPKEIHKKHYYKGDIIVNKNDFALLRIDYTIVKPEVYSSRVISINRNTNSGTIYLDSINVNLQFHKFDNKYHIKWFKNECYYKYVYDNIVEPEYFSALNEIINTKILDDKDLSDNELNFKEISLYNFKNIKKQSDVNRSSLTRYHSRIIRKKIEELKEIYPELEIEDY